MAGCVLRRVLTPCRATTLIVLKSPITIAHAVYICIAHIHVISLRQLKTHAEFICFADGTGEPGVVGVSPADVRGRGTCRP